MPETNRSDRDRIRGRCLPAPELEKNARVSPSVDQGEPSSAAHPLSMPSLFLRRPYVPPLITALCLACSPEDGPTPGGDDGSGLPPALTRVSDEDGARYASLVVTADGLLHEVWTEAGSGPGRVLHAASRDGGGSWSEPEDISDRDGDPYGAGFGTALASADGRLYAVWKDDTDSTSDKVSGGIYPGTLVYRCHEQGSCVPR